MKNDIFSKLMQFLDYLEKSKISYKIERNRDEAMMVLVTVPGERIEIEFLTDGSIEVERFISDGEIYEEKHLNDILNQYSEQILFLANF